MEEELIKSEPHDLIKVRKVIVSIGIITASLFYLSWFISECIHYIARDFSIGKTLEKVMSSGDVINYLFVAIGIIVVFIIFATVIYKAISNTSLIVTNKRVYGTALFGKRVDLPLDYISAIALDGIKGIAITTASGAIKFYMVKNRQEMYGVISNLLIERQNNKENVALNSISKKSDADELKKFKELLDNGIISQEEFAAKKKQLLGL